MLSDEPSDGDCRVVRRCGVEYATRPPPSLAPHQTSQCVSETDSRLTGWFCTTTVIVASFS